MPHALTGVGLFAADTMTELDIINKMLALEGQSPLSSIDDDHPMMAACRDIIERVSDVQQSRGLWYNTFRETWQPEADGKIYLPDDTLRLDSMPHVPGRTVVLMGNVLMDLEDRPLESSVEVYRTRKLPIRMLPPIVAHCIASECCLVYAQSHIKDPSEVEVAQQQLRDATIAVNAEHTRNARFNAYYHSARVRMVSYSYGRNPVNRLRGF